MSADAYLELMKAWLHSPDPAPFRLDRTFVHKRDARNVFITRVEPISPDIPDEHLAQLAIDADHPYHFEHAQDHVPGMMLIEAGRQLAMAIAHLYYNVPFKTVFVVDEMNIGFKRFAELAAPIFVHSWVREKQYRRNQLVAMSSGGEFLQDGEVVATLSGRWTMYDRALIARLRRRSPPAPEVVAAAADPASRAG